MHEFRPPGRECVKAVFQEKGQEIVKWKKEFKWQNHEILQCDKHKGKHSQAHTTPKPF